MHRLTTMLRYVADCIENRPTKPTAVAAPRKRTRFQAVALVAVLGVALLGMNSCTDSSTSSKEQRNTVKGYDTLASNQPLHPMTYSPTRATLNRWIDTWGKRGALAYVYLTAQGGQVIGYYVLEGPPVSACVSGTSPDRATSYDDSGDDTQNLVTRSAPSIDGVYYGGSGDCQMYYGFDAATQTLVQFSVSDTQALRMFSQPFKFNENYKPLGCSVVSSGGKVRKAADC